MKDYKDTLQWKLNGPFNSIRVQTIYLERLKQVAKKQLPNAAENAFTILITYWADDTYRLELRHANDDGIHRFYYEPTVEANCVLYCIYTIDQMIAQDIDTTHNIIEQKRIYLE